eukprot:1185538-Prorocentrum_minimum.AAC.2
MLLFGGRGGAAEPPSGALWVLYCPDLRTQDSRLEDSTGTPGSSHPDPPSELFVDHPSEFVAYAPRRCAVESTPGAVGSNPGAVESTPGAVEYTPGAVGSTPGVVIYPNMDKSWVPDPA